MPIFLPQNPIYSQALTYSRTPTLSLLTHSTSSHPVLPCVWIHTVLCLFSFEALLLECYLLIPHLQTPPGHSSGPSSLHSSSSFSGNESILPEPLYCNACLSSGLCPVPIPEPLYRQVQPVKQSLQDGPGPGRGQGEDSIEEQRWGRGTERRHCGLQLEGKAQNASAPTDDSSHPPLHSLPQCPHVALTLEIDLSPHIKSDIHTRNPAFLLSC